MYVRRKQPLPSPRDRNPLLIYKERKEKQYMSSIRFTTMIFSLSLILAVRSSLDPGDFVMRRGEGEGSSSFKIAIFADLHFGEDAWTEWGPQQDVNSVRVMSNVLDAEKPDFVIYLGDVITANNIMIENASLYWDEALSPTRARGIPWCTVFGNHDDAAFEWPIQWFSDSGIPQRDCPKTTNLDDEEAEECCCSYRGTTRLELMKTEIVKNRLLSHSRNGPSTLWPSVSNYIIKLSSFSNHKEALLYMYLLDSGGGSYPQVISDAQVKWFQNMSQDFNPDSSVPEIIFWHIPSKAFRKVSSKCKHNNNGITNCCIGSMFSEKVAPQEAEMGIMEVLARRSSVKALFVGHNHGLDWCCPYEKQLWLCFARHTGYGGYGNWSRGARIVEITNHHQQQQQQQHVSAIKSWIRMEHGQVHSEVILMSPYY